MEPTEPTNPKRVRSFAIFFKNYMSISTLVVAALPVPVTSLGFIPTFAAQKNLLSVYTSLFCFLLLGFVFYLRHSLARTMFPDFFFRWREVTTILPWWSLSASWRRVQILLVNALPLLFIASSLVLVFQYNDVLNSQVNRVRSCNQQLRWHGPDRVVRNLSEGTCSPVESNQASETQRAPAFSEDQYPLTFKGILANTDLNEIPYGSRLMILYVGIFLTAETAFILMAIKEYLQDLVGLTDVDLIKIRHSTTTISVSKRTPEFAQSGSEGADV
jgi:hypothetical protein